MSTSLTRLKARGVADRVTIAGAEGVVLVYADRPFRLRWHGTGVWEDGTTVLSAGLTPISVRLDVKRRLLLLHNDFFMTYITLFFSHLVRPVRTLATFTVLNLETQA